MQHVTHRPEAATVLEDYLTDAELAAELGVTARTLARWRRLKEGPPITRVGRKVKYRRDAVKAWLDACEMAS